MTFVTHKGPPESKSDSWARFALAKAETQATLQALAAIRNDELQPPLVRLAASRALTYWRAKIAATLQRASNK